MAFDTGGFSASLQNHRKFASRNTKKRKMAKRERETERERDGERERERERDGVRNIEKGNKIVQKSNNCVSESIFAQNELVEPFFC